MTERRPTSALERLRALDAARGRASDDKAGDSRQDPDGPATTPGKRRGLLVAGSVVVVLLWKFKAVLLLLLGKLKLLLGGLKLLKLGKLFTTGWTMLLSIWVYAQYYGWPFATGFVVLILVHELGHGLAARLVGMPVGAPVFIPFFGAMIGLKRMPRTTFEDFVIGAGGPVAGALGAFLCLGATTWLDERWAGLVFVVAYFTIVINLFNLIPVWQLDGARMTAPLTPGLWAWALAALAIVTFVTAGEGEHLNPIALFLLLGGGYQLFRAWRARRTGAEPPQDALRRLSRASQLAAEQRDVEVTTNQRRVAAAVYVVWACLLVALVNLLHAKLPVVELGS